jgi:hypothetical protein
MEHVGYQFISIKNVLLFAVQVLIQPVWYAISGGCVLYRQTWTHIERAGFESIDLTFEYPKEMHFIVRATVWGNATTHKTIDH